MPAGIDPVTAVLARLVGVSMPTLMTTAARPGALVAVTGLGPVGYLAAHLFRLSNYEVIGHRPGCAPPPVGVRVRHHARVRAGAA